MAKLLSDKVYHEEMLKLGFTYDEELGKYFYGENAFLYNVEDNINEVADILFAVNAKGYPTLMADSLQAFLMRGAEVALGEGGIDEYGNKSARALYCTNYRKLYSKQEDREKTK